MAQKTIIANYGDGDLGKTESIILACKMLKRVATSYEVKHEDKEDACAVLIINGVKVGICSQGDPWSCQKGWMETLVDKENCTIILAACRHSGETTKLIERYEGKGYRVYWTSNARLFEKGTPHVAPKGIRTRFNEQWATEIANLIESWCYA